jgi:FkbM family methyltransferase
MKNIFLCFGAHDGSLVSKLDKLNSIDVYGKHIIWDEIHLFEPQVYHYNTLSTLAMNDSRIIFHNSAVSTHNTSSKFYVKGGLGNCSSTLDEYKHTGKLHYVIDVNTIDILEWISINTSEDDFIVIDMDIECEEYNILPVLMNSNVSNQISFISVEFHNGKSSKWNVNSLDQKINHDAHEFFGDRLLNHDQLFG